MIKEKKEETKFLAVRVSIVKIKELKKRAIDYDDKSVQAFIEEGIDYILKKYPAK